MLLLVVTHRRPPIQPTIRIQRRSPIQLLIKHPFPTNFLLLFPISATSTSSTRDILRTPSLQQRGNIIPGLTSLIPRPMQEPEIGGTSRLPCEPESFRIRPQILMHLEGRSRRPVGVAAVDPGFVRPAGVSKRRRLRYVLVGKHLSQDIEDLVFGLSQGLAFDAVGLFVDDSGEEDV